MKIAGEYTFEAPRTLVYEGLQDPEVLTAVMPGCEKLEKIGENEYEGALNIKIGPVQGKFMGKVRLENLREPEGYTLHIDGRGAPGFVKAKAEIQLDPAEGGGTKMSYDSDAQVGGRIASVGQRLIDSSAKAIIKQSLDGLDATLKARLAEKSGDEEAAAKARAAAAPKSQGELAAAVAKDVAKDLIPKPATAVIVVLIILALLYFVVF